MRSHDLGGDSLFTMTRHKDFTATDHRLYFFDSESGQIILSLFSMSHKQGAKTANWNTFGRLRLRGHPRRSRSASSLRHTGRMPQSGAAAFSEPSWLGRSPGSGPSRLLPRSGLAINRF